MLEVRRVLSLNRRGILAFSAILTLALLFPLAEVSANGWVFQIVTVRLLDDTGIPRTSFARGQFVMVEATILNIMPTSPAPTEESFLMLAKMEKDFTMWGLGFFRASLLSGSSITAGPGIMIPTNAPTGTHTMTVYVWSDWASLGGYPVADYVVVTFTVT